MKIEIWSDVVCPWCYIGKRRLENALEKFDHADEVEVIWRSFQLDPSAPEGQAIPLMEYLTRRFGAQSAQMTERVIGVARTEGLEFDYGKALSVNTFHLHRMLHLAAALGVADTAKELLLRAYFTEGADLSDPDTLVALMKEAGVDPERTRQVLDSDEYADAVQADIAEAHALGASGVPFFVIDRKYGISGAQPTEVFLQALNQAGPRGQSLAAR